MPAAKIILTFLQFLPEFLELAKLFAQKVDAGLEEVAVRRALREIQKAFKDPDPAASARRLNDVFRGKLQARD